MSPETEAALSAILKRIELIHPNQGKIATAQIKESLVIDVAVLRNAIEMDCPKGARILDRKETP